MWYRVIDELAHRYLGPERALFMDYFQDWSSNYLALQGASPELVINTMANRTAEYAGYRKWVPRDEEETGGTLLWEAATHIGEYFDIGERYRGSESPAFLIRFAGVFVERLKQTLVYEFLTGRKAPEK